MPLFQSALVRYFFAFEDCTLKEVSANFVNKMYCNVVVSTKSRDRRTHVHTEPRDNSPKVTQARGIDPDRPLYIMLLFPH